MMQVAMPATHDFEYEKILEAESPEDAEKRACEQFMARFYPGDCATLEDAILEVEEVS